jgi:hypothetical protein
VKTWQMIALNLMVPAVPPRQARPGKLMRTRITRRKTSRLGYRP